MRVWLVRILRIVSEFSVIVMLWMVFSINDTEMNVWGWTLIHVNNAKSITPPVFPSVDLNVWIVNKVFLFFSGAPLDMIDIFVSCGHETNPHGWTMLCTMPLTPTMIYRWTPSVPCHFLWLPLSDYKVINVVHGEYCGPHQIIYIYIVQINKNNVRV